MPGQHGAAQVECAIRSTLGSMHTPHLKRAGCQLIFAGSRVGQGARCPAHLCMLLDPQMPRCMHKDTRANEGAVPS